MCASFGIDGFLCGFYCTRRPSCYNPWLYMSYFAETLVGGQIDSVLTDSEVTYIMLSNGTQVTIRGLIIVQPKPVPPKHSTAASAG